jgi:hypothetical protein
MWRRLNHRPGRSIVCSSYDTEPATGVSFLTVSLTKDVGRGRAEEGPGHLA